MDHYTYVSPTDELHAVLVLVTGLVVAARIMLMSQACLETAVKLSILPSSAPDW